MIPIRVVKKLIAQTLKALIRAHVNRVLMEMEQFAKVKELFNAIHVYKSVNCNKVSFLVLSDFDECSLEPNPCGDNADCTNTEGSYSCSCKKGFTGNVSACEGTCGFILYMFNNVL